MVGEVRGVGLIAAVELVKTKEPRVAFDASEGVGAYCSLACQEAGLVVRNMGDAMAFCPPLIITEAQIDELIEKFAVGLERTWQWLN